MRYHRDNFEKWNDGIFLVRTFPISFRQPTAQKSTNKINRKQLCEMEESK